MRKRGWFLSLSAVAVFAVVATVIVADTVTGTWAVDNGDAKKWCRVWANISNPPNNHSVLVGITANQNSDGTVEVFSGTTPAQSNGKPTYPNPGGTHPPAMTQDIDHGNSFTNTVSATEIWVCQKSTGASGGGKQIADSSVNHAMVSSTWSEDGDTPLTLWSTTQKRICFTVSVNSGQNPVTVTILDGVNTVASLTAEEGNSVCVTTYATSIGITPIDENSSAGTFQYSIYDVFQQGG